MMSDTSVRRELGVGVVHLLELVVGHVGLGQQDVHVPGHPPGDGVDRVGHLDARGFSSALAISRTACWACATAMP